MSGEELTYFQRSFIANPDNKDNPVFELPEDLKIIDLDLSCERLLDDVRENHAELRELFRVTP